MKEVMTQDVTTVTTADLVSRLAQSRGASATATQPVLHVERRPSPFRTSFAIEEIVVTLRDGTVLELLLKDVSSAGLAAHARRVKPRFLQCPGREVEVYRRFLAPIRIGPALFAAVNDAALGQQWLLLEHVAGVELYQVGERAIWEEVARWLARFHASLIADDALCREADAAGLVRYDAPFFHRWLRRALRFVMHDPSRGRDRRGVLEHVAGRYDELVQRLLSLPASLLHGDFFASNILVQETEHGRRVCPVDWEMAGVGPGLVDLAALCAGSWSDADRTSIALAYQREAISAGLVLPASTSAFLAAFNACRLHLAVQLLGWSARWIPPAAHDHDWLREAEELIEQVES
jgi:aminoglycoside phosphotransferase (APT) family kinase protein